jgi:hypothetical protein
VVSPVPPVVVLDDPVLVEPAPSPIVPPEVAALESNELEEWPFTTLRQQPPSNGTRAALNSAASTVHRTNLRAPESTALQDSAIQ